jgi:hypothetical protein
LRSQQRHGEKASGANAYDRAKVMFHISSLLLPTANGSRLSCGRTARGLKELEPQIKRLASEATQFYPHGRPAASSAC